MTLTIELSPAEEERLAAAAKQEGIEPAALLKKLVAEHLPGNGVPGGAPRQAMTPQEKIRALDELAERNRHLPVLPPDAFERESLYDERL